MYSNDPCYWQQKPVKPVRLWPYVLAVVIAGLLLWAYCEPIPAHTKAESPMIYQVP